MVTVVLPLTVEAVFAVLGVLVNPGWFTMNVVLLFTPPGLVCAALVHRNRPTGIVVDESGIRIGAVGSSAAAGRHPTVNHQSWTVFRCPRESVISTRVVTDPASLRELRTSPELRTLTNRWSVPRTMRTCKLGVLTAPFMRAALVIELTPHDVTFPDVRPARFYRGRNGGSSRRMHGEPSLTWVAPTRHPEALREALSHLS
ncbi:hypothetical protein DN069_13245 [Streptacidiphilus pinicola]|uniref:Uncharacterized protein n=1 Tax=Streptacidiphilus pinicola TaxID=2219663 RepID=A0A2X0IPJ8_9ACTN|nr:hypothetical protein DN069_13245 [Streptacidiphilus pinicola]